MISQSSVAVATGCWNWDRRAARTTERSSISRAGGAQPLYARPGAGDSGAAEPQLQPRVGPFRRQPRPPARLRSVWLPASRCHRGVGTALVCFSGVSWRGGTVPRREGGSCSRRSGRGEGHVVGSSQGTHATGVQGSLSSCNIPHMKYEAKFLLILHEEPGVNCVLPNSGSRVLQSLCLQSPGSFRQRLFQIFLLFSLP